MMTVDERAAYQQNSLDIMEQAKKLKLPHGMRADLAFHDSGSPPKAGKNLTVSIFSDIVADVEEAKALAHSMLKEHGLPSKSCPCTVVVTTVAKMKRIFGDAWEWGMEFKGIPIKKKK